MSTENDVVNKTNIFANSRLWKHSKSIWNTPFIFSGGAIFHYLASSRHGRNTAQRASFVSARTKLSPFSFSRYIGRTHASSESKSTINSESLVADRFNIRSFSLLPSFTLVVAIRFYDDVGWKGCEYDQFKGAFKQIPNQAIQGIFLINRYEWNRWIQNLK